MGVSYPFLVTTTFIGSNVVETAERYPKISGLDHVVFNTLDFYGNSGLFRPRNSIKIS